MGSGGLLSRQILFQPVNMVVAVDNGWLADQRGYRGEGPPPALPGEIRIEAAKRYIAAYELVNQHGVERQLFTS